MLTIGPVGNVAARAVKRAAAEGVSAAHYDLRFARPLDEELLDEVGRRFERVVTVEDGGAGGVGSAVRDFFDRRGYRTQVRSPSIPDDRFVEHGTPAELYAQCGFDEEGILRAILER
ncbi:MAG: transketolase C-terminal domain-containing protein [Alistipes shahii]